MRPVSARVVEELWAADPSKCPRNYAANASWGGGGGHNLRVLAEAGGFTKTRKPGQSAHVEAFPEESPQSLEKQGEADCVPENLEISGVLEIFSVKGPLS